MSQIEVKRLSSLEKVFLKDTLSGPEYTKASALRGETFSYQIAYRSKDSELNYTPFQLSVKSELKPFLTLRWVKNVPSELPAYETLFGGYDEDYITTQPGLFPDLLSPAEESPEAVVNAWKALWITVKIPKDIEPGEYTISVVLKSKQEKVEVPFQLSVLMACLPEQKLIFSQWFHADCLYAYYREEPFSERHWEIMQNFIKTAAENGINMLLTPLFTPPMDTDVGRERPTIQLVDIVRESESYTFDFSRLRRWIHLCRECGIRYFEMPPFFTQWGAKYTPKICVTENGVSKKIFGWHVPATAPEYRCFLQQFIPALKEILHDEEIENYTFFHVSDEPTEENKEDYRRAKNVVMDLLEDFPVMDALSHYSLYQEKVIERPIIAIHSISDFIEEKVENLWAYNCCAQATAVSNRFMAMPSCRNRIIGLQLYRYQIKGFLHWGYNFYYSARSRKLIDPFRTTDALNAFPSGDAFSVYPGADGKPQESIRLVVFHEALQDMRALELLETLVGREAVLKILEQDIPPLTFEQYPKSPAYILDLRERVNAEIAEHLKQV